MNEQKSQWAIGYKELKNLIHNELGITRDDMNEIINKIVRDEITEAVGRNGHFIRTAIKEIIKEEMMLAIHNQKYPKSNRNLWSYNTEKNDFNTFISEILKEEIVKLLKEQFDVSFDINKK